MDAKKVRKVKKSKIYHRTCPACFREFDTKREAQIYDEEACRKLAWFNRNYIRVEKTPRKPK